jgi:hypothetical protein
VGQAKLKSARKKVQAKRSGKRLLQSVTLRAQIHIYNDRGKLVDVQSTQEIPVFEAEIPESIVAMLRKKGLEFDDAAEETTEPVKG